MRNLTTHGSILPLLLLACTLSTAQAQQTIQPQMVQDPTLNNLVHPEGYQTAEPGTLGRVTRVGDGPRDMVLVAGAGFGGEIFDGFMKSWSDRFTMYAVTLPGMGGTPAPPMPDTGTSYGEQSWNTAARDAVVPAAVLVNSRAHVEGEWCHVARLSIRRAAHYDIATIF